MCKWHTCAYICLCVRSYVYRCERSLSPLPVLRHVHWPRWERWHPLLLAELIPRFPARWQLSVLENFHPLMVNDAAWPFLCCASDRARIGEACSTEAASVYLQRTSSNVFGGGGHCSDTTIYVVSPYCDATLDCEATSWKYLMQPCKRCICK